MAFFTFIGISVVLALTFYGMYNYVSKHNNKDDDK